MSTYSGRFEIDTKGETDIIDITNEVETIVKDSRITSGLVTVWVAGSTAGISTIEYEGGLLDDLRVLYEKMAPRHANYSHNLRWHDGNGYAHIRASMTGQGLTIPIVNGILVRGTWQQIILVDFDNRPRKREVTVQVVGE